MIHMIWIPLNGKTESCVLKACAVEYWSLPWIQTLDWLLIDFQPIINLDFINTSVDTWSTLHWFLGWHLIDTSSIPWWTLNQHSINISINSWGWLIFNWCIWVNEHSANYQPAVDLVLPRYWLGYQLTHKMQKPFGTWLLLPLISDDSCY